MDKNNIKFASLIVVGNLPDKTNFTFANSLKGAKSKYRNEAQIIRVVILDTEESIEASDERSKVIRDIIGIKCSIVSVPCLEDFRVHAFNTLADEIRKKDIEFIIVDITNGKRNQTFDLIVATSICRIDRVIYTAVPREYFNIPYDKIDDSLYEVQTIKPFSKDPSLESAAHFELIYYTDKIKESIDFIRGHKGTSIAKYSNIVESGVTNAVINYFSGDKDNFENALKRLVEIHEGLASRFEQDLLGKRGSSNFADSIKNIRTIISEPARKSSSEFESVDRELLAAVMLDELFEFCRKFRNYLSHPNRREIEKCDVQFMLFTTFTLLEKISTSLYWISRNK